MAVLAAGPARESNATSSPGSKAPTVYWQSARWLASRGLIRTGMNRGTRRAGWWELTDKGWSLACQLDVAGAQVELWNDSGKVER